MPSATLGFRGNPSSTVASDGANYTVPAGKYAYICVNNTVNAAGTNDDPPNNGHESSAVNSSATLWLKSGDTITQSTTAASLNVTSTGFHSTESLSSWSLGGTVLSEARAVVYLYNISTDNLRALGAAKATLVASLFDN